ncbi:MAG: heparan-alpha-glucosaminide N-acetyltransferase domain-containing protein [Candidatus Hodarchaeota archaeon]
MKRLKGIDIFRGLIMVLMIFVHLRDWWLIGGANATFSYITRPFIDRTFAPAFMFSAGLSTFISYDNRIKKKSEEYSYRTIRNEYIFRAIIIAIIGLIYNIFVAIMESNPSLVWTWFMLFSIGFSLLMAWPLLKISIFYKIIFSLIVITANEILFWVLIPYIGQFNFYGIIYHIFFNSLYLDPILESFFFLLIGIVIGELIADIFSIKDQRKRRKALKKKLLLPSLIIGGALVIYTFVFIFPLFFNNIGFYWIYFSMGICLIFNSILLSLEEYGVFERKKSYKFLFYFSYYSLTVYLSHYLFYFFFLGQLNVYTLCLLILVTTILYGLLLRFLYFKLGPKISLKIQIARFAEYLAGKLNNKNKNINERKIR